MKNFKDFLNETEHKDYYVHYIYNFSVGQNTHWVRIYDEYSDEDGLDGEMVLDVENSRATQLLKDVKMYLTRPQLSSLIYNMQSFDSDIILPDGKIGR